MTTPCFILVAPQMGENIGAAARVMANFGSGRSTAGGPRDGWPNPGRRDDERGGAAGRGEGQVFDRVEDAIADCALVLATTARPRGMEKPVIGAGEAIAQMRASQARTAFCLGRSGQACRTRLWR